MSRHNDDDTFCEQYKDVQEIDLADLAPVLGKEQRPWNPDWFVYETAAQRYLQSAQQRLLEFGCGQGVAAVRFATLGFEVDGFDLSPSNIDIARDLAERHGVGDRCRFEVMAGETLEYPNEQFDVITGMDSLSQVKLPQAITQAARVLKRGGIAIFKEQIQTPLVNPIGEATWGQALTPLEQSPNSEAYKLTAMDLRLIEKAFDRMEIQKFTLLSRLDRLIPKSSEKTRACLQKLDHSLLGLCPSLARFGSTVVLSCHKKAETLYQVA